LTSSDPAKLNDDGLEAFANGNPAQAQSFLEKAYRELPEESGILVNLGLALMQQSQIKKAEHCYQIAAKSPEQRVRRSAAKNLGFLYLWSGRHKEGWHWHGKRFEGECFNQTIWRGDPLNHRVLTVWNDVGMGDAFQFVRYTLPLIQRKERIRFAVDKSQIPLFRNHLAWSFMDVVDRNTIDHLDGEPHIPLMSLIPLLDSSTIWGRQFAEPIWRIPNTSNQSASENKVGICWASNPQDRTMHRYKSTTSKRLLQLQQQKFPSTHLVSLQTDEAEAHNKLGLIPPTKNWCETLMLIAECNQVISVDTAVAHLAAGSGIPTCLLLGHPPDWRWQQLPSQDSTPLWYPCIQKEDLTT
jgi:hypothetical protein